ncbi:MAG: SpoIIE family protein phosphatase [Candidatus Riflebacteria bacterium]|nr:SpoIIE family protein phosphatase [Candidatus Riflebacteria bacterium]
MSSNAQLPLNHRWPIAFWSGAILCFVVFPLFLLDVGLDSMLETRQNLQKQELYHKLEQNLEKLLQYRNSRHYHHALFKKIFDIAEAQNQPASYLNRALANLKERNPDVFRFIVWDDKGKIIEKLTDEKSYRYIVKTLYEVFSKIKDDNEANYPGNPELLPVVAQRINLLRSYLGAFLVPEHMNLPLLRSSLGECIIASSDREKSNFWYRIGENFGIFAQIHHDAIESQKYLEKLVVAINRGNETGFRIGIVDLAGENVMFTGGSLPRSEEVLIELKKFQHFAEPRLETEHYLILARMINQSTLGFSLVEKRNHMIAAKTVRRLILIGSIVALFVLFFALFVFFKKSGLISIRFKLAILFIYANGLPLMILGFLGFEYLQQTRQILLDQAHKQTADLLREFDTRYELIKADYAEKLNKAVDKVNQYHPEETKKLNDLKEFSDLVMSTRPYDFILSDLRGKYQSGPTISGGSGAFFANMSRTLLYYMNLKTYSPPELFRGNKTLNRNSEVSAQSFLATDKVIFHQFIRKVGKIGSEQMGSEGRQYFWHLLGDFKSRNFTNLLVVSWTHDALQEAYLKMKIEDLNTNSGQIKCFAIVESNGVAFPTGQVADREVLNLFRQTFNLKIAKNDLLKIDGKDYAAFGTIGRKLDKVALVGLYPLEKIDSQIGGLQSRLIIFALLSLSLTLGIGRLLSAQFMEPVKELEKGVQAIGRQDFRYRLKIDSHDEFGHLGSVFNRAIESLEDLEVAKIVQENLFPLENLKMNRLEVYGKSVSMSRLGGDYYDYFEIDKNRAGILMGDVAGHGVPAALLMAMAKASVLIAEQEKMRPALLLAALHKVIYRVKSSKIKRMMTCQYFCVDSVTGNYLFSNAGHCFPALIRAGGKDVSLIQAIGSPLGITKKPRYEDLELNLAEGDILLLYTDGIIEAQNKAGLEMGFDRFLDILRNEFSSDLETYYQRIFDAYYAWSPEADDDITMVLIRFGLSEKQS